jgi:hypothetical protein
VIVTGPGLGVVERLRTAGTERLERVLTHLSAGEMKRCLNVMEFLNRAAEIEFRPGSSSHVEVGAGVAEA